MRLLFVATCAWLGSPRSCRWTSCSESSLTSTALYRCTTQRCWRKCSWSRRFGQRLPDNILQEKVYIKQTVYQKTHFTEKKWRDTKDRGDRSSDAADQSWQSTICTVDFDFDVCRRNNANVLQENMQLLQMWAKITPVTLWLHNQHLFMPMRKHGTVIHGKCTVLCRVEFDFFILKYFFLTVWKV